MSTDALTITRVADGEDVWGSHTRSMTWTVAPSNSYPTGGFTISPQRFGLKVVRGIVAGGSNTAAVGYVPWYDSQTGKLQVLQSAATAAPLAQVGSGTDLSALQFSLVFLGE